MLVVDKSTREFPSGWVFFYNSERYIQTGNVLDSLAGNVPIIVDRADGSVHETGRWLGLAHCISEYERIRKTTA
jgi:hypothetical protein